MGSTQHQTSPENKVLKSIGEHNWSNWIDHSRVLSQLRLKRDGLQVSPVRATEDTMPLCCQSCFTVGRKFHLPYNSLEVEMTGKQLNVKDDNSAIQK